MDEYDGGVRHASRARVPISQPELDLPELPRCVPARRRRRPVPVEVSTPVPVAEQPGFDFDETPGDVPLLDRYGLRAMEHWRHHAPPHHREVAEPRRFFAELGERLASRVTQLAVPLEQQLPADLPAVERIEQVTRIRSQAEEVALVEQLQVIQDLSLAEERHLVELLGALPACELIDDELLRFDDQVAQGRELEGQGATTVAEEACRARLTRLQGLLAVANDPDQAVPQRILAAEEAAVIRDMLTWRT